MKMPHHRSLADEQRMPPLQPALQPAISDMLPQASNLVNQSPMLTPIVFMKHHPEHGQVLDPTQQYVMLNGTLGTLASVHSGTALPEL